MASRQIKVGGRLGQDYHEGFWRCEGFLALLGQKAFRIMDKSVLTLAGGDLTGRQASPAATAAGQHVTNDWGFTAK